MKVELIKEEGADGIWYMIRVDGWCRGAKRNYEEAIDFYNKVVRMIRESKASETLLSIDL